MKAWRMRGVLIDQPSWVILVAIDARGDSDP